MRGYPGVAGVDPPGGLWPLLDSAVAFDYMPVIHPTYEPGVFPFYEPGVFLFSPI